MTLDPDVDLLIKRAMRERGLTFKQAINAAIRAGASRDRPEPRPELPTYDMGRPTVDVTKALRLAGELEDEDRSRRAAQGH